MQHAILVPNLDTSAALPGWSDWAAGFAQGQGGAEEAVGTAHGEPGPQALGSAQCQAHQARAGMLHEPEGA